MSPFDPAWEPDAGPEGAQFGDAMLAATLLAIDPAGLGGLLLRTWSGPQRDCLIQNLATLFPPGTTAKKLPLSITDDRLLGGLDLTATLQTGKPTPATGLLQESENQILIIAMAERLPAATASKITAALDTGAKLTLIALDEGATPDETPPTALQERLAFTITTANIPPESATWPAPHRIKIARKTLPNIATPTDAIHQLCTIAATLGITSLRPPILALRAARAAAALAGHTAIQQTDIALAAKLILLPRATQLPSSPEDTPTETEENPPNPQDNQSQQPDKPIEDHITAAEKAALPPELLAALAAASAPRRTTRGAGAPGKSASPTRGRPAGTRRGPLTTGAKISLVETLRAAAPWQPLRHHHHTQTRKIIINKADIRLKKFKQQPATIAIFAVDASGSSAINRLSEAKGAIQLLLADCYIRRDQVSLIAFRGTQAQTLLPPTNALARAKRALAGLPGGGPTPLATGIDAALTLAQTAKRASKHPLLVILTDGGANIARNGQPGRAAAAADALRAATACRAKNIAALVVDTAPRPQKFVSALATAMGARYLPLPYADPTRLSQAVQEEGSKNAGHH